MKGCVSVLADQVLAKLEACEATDQALDSSIVEIYSQLGVHLTRYRSGKLPKAFQVLPLWKSWTAVLDLTNPLEWSPQAVYQGTKLFCSTLKPAAVAKFYSKVLYPHFRRNIRQTGKLNHHLYMALQKALYKSEAFFKAVVLPFCEQEDATLKEAAILGSVLAKTSLSSLHSAVILLKIASMEYSGPNSIIFRILLDKRLILPHKVMDGLLEYFDKFSRCSLDLPVLWHQSFLAFCQQYKNNLSPQQKQALLDLTVVHHHHQISPEIQKELSTES